MIGGDQTVETFEQVVGEIGNPPPAAGCLVWFVSFQMDPARVDENVTFFNGEVLPAIKRSPAFRAVRHLIDRASGRGLTAMIVSDDDALRAAEVGFEAASRGARTLSAAQAEAIPAAVSPSREGACGSSSVI
jgi:hypothetical protein